MRNTCEIVSKDTEHSDYNQHLGIGTKCYTNFCPKT